MEKLTRSFLWIAVFALTVANIYARVDFPSQVETTRWFPDLLQGQCYSRAQIDWGNSQFGFFTEDECRHYLFSAEQMQL